MGMSIVKMFVCFNLHYNIVSCTHVNTIMNQRVIKSSVSLVAIFEGLIEQAQEN